MAARLRGAYEVAKTSELHDSSQYTQTPTHTVPDPSINMSASAPSFSSSANSGQFDWLGKIGATREAIATLNDQPYVFFVLVAALVILILEGVFIWYIHFATMKPEQKKKKMEKKEKKKGKKDEKKPGGKPPAQR
ncbi:hypothetical protein F4782DRAFT_529100 [Xylaria castorea]|nr:hypothetical protein F4782DRAFT_529100 [Xylaria castorea]